MSLVPRLNVKGIATLNETLIQSTASVPDLYCLLGCRPSTEDFRTIAVVGQGAYAMVKVVRHKVTNKIFALKQMSKVDLAKKSKASLIRHEIDLLYKANSVWIPRLYFAWQDKYFLYLLMEYTAGGDLMKHLADHHLFNEKMCKMIIAELVLCLVYVHETLQCAHRDIKPENILIDHLGHIKLADFGLSKFVGKNNYLCKRGSITTRLLNYESKKSSERLYEQLKTAFTERQLKKPMDMPMVSNPEGNSVTRTCYQRLNHTHNDQNLTHYRWIKREKESFQKPIYHERLMTGAGTVDYMAPEIHRQRQQMNCYQGYTRSADWWSVSKFDREQIVGVVLFDMLFGVLPFTDEKRIGRITTARIIHWRRYLKELPRRVKVSSECEDFLRKLLAEPEDRISSAREAMQHPWLQNIDWSNIRNGNGPFDIDVVNFGLKNFDALHVNEFAKWEIQKKHESQWFPNQLIIDIPDPPFIPRNKCFETNFLSSNMPRCLMNEATRRISDERQSFPPNTSSRIIHDRQTVPHMTSHSMEKNKPYATPFLQKITDGFSNSTQYVKERRQAISRRKATKVNIPSPPSALKQNIEILQTSEQSCRNSSKSHNTGVILRKCVSPRRMLQSPNLKTIASNPENYSSIATSRKKLGRAVGTQPKQTCIGRRPKMFHSPLNCNFTNERLHQFRQIETKPGSLSRCSELSKMEMINCGKLTQMTRSMNEAVVIKTTHRCCYNTMPYSKENSDCHDVKMSLETQETKPSLSSSIQSYISEPSSPRENCTTLSFNVSKEKNLEVLDHYNGANASEESKNDSTLLQAKTILRTSLTYFPPEHSNCLKEQICLNGLPDHYYLVLEKPPIASNLKHDVKQPQQPLEQHTNQQYPDSNSRRRCKRLNEAIDPYRVTSANNK